MKKLIKTHAISFALGVLLTFAGWNIMTWQFWAWVLPLNVLLVLRDDAMHYDV